MTFSMITGNINVLEQAGRVKWNDCLFRRMMVS